MLLVIKGLKQVDAGDFDDGLPRSFLAPRSQGGLANFELFGTISM